MSTVEKWATVALVFAALANTWDLIDPRAMDVTWNNGGRLLLSFLGAIASLTALLLVVGASAAVIVIVVLAVLLLGAIRALADG